MPRTASGVVRDIQLRKTANDKIYTPLQVAKKMIEICKIQPEDKVLDPSKGGGVFYDNFPECIKSYCEIEENKDFFDYNEEVDIIVGNPPYSLWSKWINKTISLNPKKICYIFGTWNFTNVRLRELHNNGYNIQKIVFCKIDWWMSPSFICLFEKKEISDCFDVFYDTILCPDCDKSGCRRKNPNKCCLDKTTE